MKKYLLAGGLALFLMLGACDDFVAYEDGEPVENTENEETAEEPENEMEDMDTEEEPVEEEVEESEPETEGSVEETVEEDLTPEEEIESIVNETIESEKITEMNINEYEGNYEIDITFEATENFSANMTKNGIHRDIVDVTLDLQASEYYVTYFLATATLPLTDDAGNEEHGQVVSASFNGDTIEELNADNETFLYDNLENVADGYSAHPDFR
jgi:hypothetical protein